jgi:peptidoglycan/xylan/chitin deacetylase (PgdA/CDA1 family)
MPLSILIYHRVLPQSDPIFPDEVDAISFEKHVRLISSCFNVIPLHDAVNALRRRSLPARAACITFDDGYADNADVALPILRRYNVQATFFVATAFLDGGRMWNDTIIESVRQVPGNMLDLAELGYGRFEITTASQRKTAITTLIGTLKYLPQNLRAAEVERICTYLQAKLPSDLMMTSAQVRTLHNAGMEIGGHTVSHPILSRMNSSDARREIADGKDALEGITGARVKLFAYPNGKPGQDYLAEHVTMVRSMGFTAAVSTAWGVANSDTDPHQLPRFTPWDSGQAKFILRMAQNLFRNSESV